MLKTFATALVIAAACCLSAGAAETKTPPSAPYHGPAASAADTVRGVHEQIKALKAECKEDPGAWLPRYQLGELYFRFGLVKRAAQRLDEALALKPDHLPSYRLAGEVHLRLKEYDKAIELWQKALELNPADQGPRAWIIRAKRTREENARLAELDARLKENPTDLDALLARARFRSERNDSKGALADLRLLLAAKPDSGEALGLAASAHYRLGHLDEAIHFWGRAVKADPKNKQYQERLAVAKQVKQIRADLTRIEADLRKRPDDGKLRSQAGELWIKLGNWRNAVRHLREAVRLLPEDAGVRKNYAVTLLQLGNMDEAVKELQKCVELDPKSPEYAKLLERIEELRNVHRSMKREGSPIPTDGTPADKDSED